MPRISINGEDLHYERAGSGPTLAMFHSLGTNSYLWREQIGRWQDRFTCIAFDARGHGRSSNNGGITMEKVARDVHAALQELELLPAILMGISMGGLQCARLHAIDPGAVTGIVYADSFASLGEAGPARIAQMEEKIARMSMKEFAADYAADTLLPAGGPARQAALRAAIAGVSKENYLQAVRSVFTEDVRDHLRAIDKPMLIVVGEQDQRTPLAASRIVQDLVPGAELMTIPGAAHLANIDNPEGFHQAVEPFLQRFAI